MWGRDPLVDRSNLHTDQYNTPKTQDVGYYVNQTARTYLNRCLCALCYRASPPTNTIVGYPSVDCRRYSVDTFILQLHFGDLAFIKVNVNIQSTHCETESAVFSAHISVGISVETNSNRALHNLDSFVSVVALIEMSNTSSEETGHYKRSSSRCKEKVSYCFRLIPENGTCVISFQVNGTYCTRVQVTPWSHQSC